MPHYSNGHKYTHTYAYIHTYTRRKKYRNTPKQYPRTHTKTLSTYTQTIHSPTVNKQYTCQHPNHPNTNTRISTKLFSNPPTKANNIHQSLYHSTKASVSYSLPPAYRTAPLLYAAAHKPAQHRSCIGTLHRSKTNKHKQTQSVKISNITAMLVIKTKQQIGTPEYMNISYINKEICRLFGVQPDDDLCAAPITEHQHKGIREPARELEAGMLWAWSSYTLYILNKVYQDGIVPKGGYVTPSQLLTTVKNLTQNTPLNPVLNQELSKLFTWFNSQNYLLRAV